jgi:PAS domain S-box-containing protein
MYSGTARLGAWLPALSGAILSVVHADQVLARTSVTGVVVETAPPLVASLGLLAAGGWFVARRPDADVVARVDRWLVAGGLGALVVGLWTSGHFLLTGASARHLPTVVGGNVTAGMLLGLVLGLYDVRARRRKSQVEYTRKRARAERDRFAALFENVPDPVVYYEFEGDAPVFRAVNGAFEETFGFAESAVDGRTVDEVIVPPERIEEAADINAHIREGEVVQRELRRQTDNGVRDFLVSVVPVEGSDGDAGFFIAIDITEQRRRDRRLKVLNRVLRHDLRNAMNVVLGYVDLLGSSPDSTERAAEVVRRRAEEMVSLSEKARTIEEALHAGDADAGATDVVSLVRRRLSAASTDYPDLETSTELPDRALARVRDPELLAAAVDNVVENAATHADRPDPHLDVSVAVDDERVRVRFADEGPGIPEQELAVLESDEETQLEHLSGLGLWLVNWVLEHTDGEATFESTDSGSVVTFALPRATETAGDDVDTVGEPREGATDD